MIGLLRSETIKVRSVWSTWLLVALAAAAAVLVGALVGYAPRRRHQLSTLLPPHGTLRWFEGVFSGIAIAPTLALVLGILVVTGEYRHRTITPTLLAEPRRSRVTAAKMTVSAGGGVILALSALVAALLLGLLLVAVGNGTMSTMLDAYRRAVPGAVLATALFALYGVGLGALVRNQVVAMLIGLGVSLLLEPIFVALFPAEGKWFPDQAASALQRSTQQASQGFGATPHPLLATWQAVVVLLAYAVVLAGAGVIVSSRADVT